MSKPSLKVVSNSPSLRRTCRATLPHERHYIRCIVLTVGAFRNCDFRCGECLPRSQRDQVGVFVGDSPRICQDLLIQGICPALRGWKVLQESFNLFIFSTLYEYGKAIVSPLTPSPIVLYLVQKYELRV